MAKKKGGKGGAAEVQDPEALKKMQEAVAEKMKASLDLEQQFSRLNTHKIDTKWREVMRREKAQEVKKALVALHQVHERKLDRKNATIENLDKDVEEAEEQYETLFQAHLKNIDNLIAVQQSRLDSLQRMFEAEVGILNNEFTTERQRLQLQHQKQRADILGILTRMEHEIQEGESDAKHEYQSVRDDVKNKNLEEKHALRILLEGNIEELWKQFQKALDDYNQATEDRKAQFEQLKEKDQESAKVIDQQMKKLMRLQENIAQLKAKISTNSREYEEKRKSLRDEKETIQAHFQDMKRRMNVHRDNQRKKLTEMTVMSNKVVRELNERVEQAERVLRLAEMNKKIETEEERVLPFYPSNLDEEAQSLIKSEEARLMKDMHETVSMLTEGEEVAMERFYQRYNKVLLDGLSLEAHKNKLLEENDNLKMILKQYLDGISVSEEVLNRVNPLFVVNGRTNAPLHDPAFHRRRSNIPCIDGPEVLHANRVNI